MNRSTKSVPADSARGIRILLADDHKIFRQGLRILLEQNGYIVESEASNGMEAVRITKQLHPDVAILDYGMPGMSGIEAAREIRKCSPETQAVVLAGEDDDADLSEAVRAGVHGYLYKSQDSEELIHTVAEVVHGDIHFSSLKSSLLDLLEPEHHHTTDLTDRERQVLMLIAAGHTTRSIGEMLRLSVKTVESHRSSIMRKLNIHRTAGLIRYAIRQRLIAP